MKKGDGFTEVKRSQQKKEELKPFPQDKIRCRKGESPLTGIMDSHFLRRKIWIFRRK